MNYNNARLVTDYMSTSHWCVTMLQIWVQYNIIQFVQVGDAHSFFFFFSINLFGLFLGVIFSSFFLFSSSVFCNTKINKRFLKFLYKIFSASADNVICGLETQEYHRVLDILLSFIHFFFFLNLFYPSIRVHFFITSHLPLKVLHNMTWCK